MLHTHRVVQGTMWRNAKKTKKGVNIIRIEEQKHFKNDVTRTNFL